MPWPVVVIVALTQFPVVNPVQEMPVPVVTVFANRALPLVIPVTVIVVAPFVCPTTARFPFNVDVPVTSKLSVPIEPPPIAMEVAVATPKTGVISVGDVENTRLVDVVPVVPAVVNPVILLKHVMLAALQFVPPLATIRVPARVTAPVVAELGVKPVVPALKLATLEAVTAHVGQVMLPVVPVMTKGEDAVTTGTPLALPIVQVGAFELDIVIPLTEDGVIAPKVKVRAGVVVGLATVQETPLAVTHDTVVTVPVPPPPVEAMVIVPLPLVIVIPDPCVSLFIEKPPEEFPIRSSPPVQEGHKNDAALAVTGGGLTELYGMKHVC